MTTEEREQSLFEIHRHIMFLATHEDLDEVRRSIKMRRDDLARQLKVELSIGDVVLIDNRKGKVERGIVKKVNRTRAVVDINSQGWNVPFSMIRKEN